MGDMCTDFMYPDEPEGNGRYLEAVRTYKLNKTMQFQGVYIVDEEFPFLIWSNTLENLPTVLCYNWNGCFLRNKTSLQSLLVWIDDNQEHCLSSIRRFPMRTGAVSNWKKIYKALDPEDAELLQAINTLRQL